MTLVITSAELEGTSEQWLQHQEAPIYDLGRTPVEDMAPKVVIQARYPITPDTNPSDRQWCIWHSMLDTMHRFPHLAPYTWLVYTFTQHDYEPLIEMITKDMMTFTDKPPEECVEIICLGRGHGQNIQFRTNNPVRVALATDGASVSYTNDKANFLLDCAIHMPQNADGE